MQDEKRVALARIVMAHREHMIMLEPLGKGLLGTTLRYDYEVRSEKDYFSHVPSPRVTKDMVSLAAHILTRKNSRTNTKGPLESSFSARPRAMPLLPRNPRKSPAT
jgi:DNA end-binding protein Ku